MPSYDKSPNFMIMSDFDARNFTSTLYTRAGSNIALNSSGRVVFSDPVYFLNGRGQSATTSLKACLEADIGDTWTISIDSQDRIKWECTASQNQDIETQFGGGAIWGLDNDYTNMSGTSVTFAGQWQRGNQIFWSAGSALYGKLSYSDSGTVYPTFYPSFPVAQDIPSLLSVRSGSGIYCLQSAEEALFSDYVQWVLRDDGRVMQVVNYVANANLINFAWADTAFRDRLGFSGLETWQTLYGRKVMIADNVMPGVIAPSRPYEDHHLAFDRLSDTRRKGDGSYGTNFKGNFTKSILRFYVDGIADTQDDYRRFVFDLGDYFYIGAKINLVQEVGEPRLNRMTSQISSSSPAYSLTHTSEDNGMHGIITGTITSITSDLPFENRIMRRIPVSMEIAHDK